MSWGNSFGTSWGTSFGQLIPTVLGICFATNTARALMDLSLGRRSSVTDETGAVLMMSEAAPIAIEDTSATVTIGDRKQ